MELYASCILLSSGLLTHILVTISNLQDIIYTFN